MDIYQRFFIYIGAFLLLWLPPSSSIIQGHPEYRPEIYNSIADILNSSRIDSFVRHINHYNQLLDTFIEHVKFKHNTILDVLRGEEETAICSRLIAGQGFKHSPLTENIYSDPGTSEVHTKFSQSRQTNISQVTNTRVSHRKKRSVLTKLKSLNIGRSMENMKDKMDLLKGLIDSGKEVALAGTAAYKAIRREIKHIHNEDDDAIIE